MIRAARYLRVPPWELSEKPKVWVAWALVAEAAEIEAQNTLARMTPEERVRRQSLAVANQMLGAIPKNDAPENGTSFRWDE